MLPRAQYLLAMGDSQVTPTATEIPYPVFVAREFYDPKLGHINMGMPGATSTQVADAYLAAQSAIRSFDAIFDMGSNNANGTTLEGDRIIVDIRRAAAGCVNGRYRVMEIIPRADRSTTSGAGRTWLEALNTSLAGEYGAKFLRRLPTLQSANDGSANDLADVAANVCPRSLLKDGVHRTQAGHRSEASAVIAAIDGGW